MKKKEDTVTKVPHNRTSSASDAEHNNSSIGIIYLTFAPTNIVGAPGLFMQMPEDAGMQHSDS